MFHLLYMYAFLSPFNQLLCFVEVGAWICAAAPTFWHSHPQDRVAPMADKSAPPSQEPPHQQNQPPIELTRKGEG